MPDNLDLYRPNVGIVLFNAQGLVWMGRRKAHPLHPGQEHVASLRHPWQFPQGGVDDGEAGCLKRGALLLAAAAAGGWLATVSIV